LPPRFSARSSASDSSDRELQLQSKEDQLRTKNEAIAVLMQAKRAQSAKNEQELREVKEDVAIQLLGLREDIYASSE
jgi:hypothetical protein